MTIRTLPITASDSEIKSLIAEWSELLAQKRFHEALDMFPCAEATTASELEATIAGYGSPDPFPDGRRFEVTTLLGRADRDDIIRRRIEVDRENLYGLDPGEYLGMVHYGDVPLNGERSDLTARFHIKRVERDELTLEFLDIHVM
jgi:hypothetical protein